MPKISIIVPVYNTEKYLRKCLDSLVNQTLSDIEIICINDCSTDNSLEILRKYASKDNRIKVIDFKDNRGAAYARNVGIEEANGEYIGFVDSDDFVDLDFYEKLYNKAIKTGADAVKGNVLEYDEKTGKSELTFFYDQNEKIRENTAYFLYGFTSAIYKKLFLTEYDIKFPEGISYFEDPYFSIKCCVNCKNVVFDDSAKYYYFQYGQSSVSNHAILSNFRDLNSVCLKLMDYMEDIDSKENYFIIFNFLYHFVFCNFNNLKIEYPLRKYLLSTLVKMIFRCKYEFYLDESLFRTIKSEINEGKFYSELLEVYKKYDYLNKDDKRPLVKILVSYIKPSFLFKSKILTPIQLGKAVEGADSKDGVQSEKNLKWLHENCEFNDDFEGGISEHNRRIGFLTGTHWAWKNYEKLGNPEYFGSFGYRKLMFPQCVKNLEEYDLVLPKEMVFKETLEEQFIKCHGKGYYNVMLNVIQRVFPEDLEALKKYMQRYSGYYAEMYILKKDLFFDFCKWIFNVLDCLEGTHKEFIVATNNREKTKELMLNFFGEDFSELAKTFNRSELRDFAFILERLTGFYLYKLAQNKDLKYKEIYVFEPQNSNILSYQNYKKLVLEQMRKNVKMGLKNVDRAAIT